MKVNPHDNPPRRITVILGAGSSSDRLLELVQPLLGSDRDIEMQGVFLEEAEVQHAAELPFVKELCRVTFSVREFTTDQFEHALNLRMRTARRALSVLARRTGVVHSFRNVRGSAVSLLRDTAAESDITLFEPVRAISAAMAHPVRKPAPLQTIVVAIDDMEAGARALLVAAHLVEGRMDLVTVFLTPSAAGQGEAVRQIFDDMLPRRPAHVRTLESTSVQDLARATHVRGAGLLVIGISAATLDPVALRALRERLRCPICLVRRWGKNGAPPE